jgi:hypothetical protein
LKRLNGLAGLARDLQGITRRYRPNVIETSAAPLA